MAQKITFKQIQIPIPIRLVKPRGLMRGQFYQHKLTVDQVLPKFTTDFTKQISEFEYSRFL